MGRSIEIILILSWLPQAVGQILVFSHWWQVKEYRLDRFWLFITSIDGRRKLNLNFVFTKFLLLFLSILNKTFSFPLILLFILIDIKILVHIFNKTLRKPTFTERAQKIVGTGLVFVLITLVSTFFRFKTLENVLLGEVLLIISPYLGILWTIPIVNRVKKEEILKAKKTLLKVKPTVIGITGSYGKTTTKEFIAHLISQKYKTAKTEGSENTEFGIARKTFKNVTDSTQYYVVEMGAYKRGEIKKLTNIVNPSIGIITGIEPQHLALFGSLENIKRAKFELIESLPKGGVAVFNFSNNECRLLAKKAKDLDSNLKVYGYRLLLDVKAKGATDMVSKIISVSRKGVDFEVGDAKETKKLFAPLAGVHFIENLTGAILVARLLGVSWKEIEGGCKSLQNPKATMQVHKLNNDTIIIDDTFNTTPKGFEAALNYLALFKNKKKVIVTPGVIELGGLSEKIHTQIGRLMKDIVDQVVLLNEEPFKALIKGLGDANKVSVIKDSRNIQKFLGRFKGNEIVILLEGRMPKELVEFISLQKC